MCLLSVYSPGALVNREHLENGATCNPDGYGFAIVVNGARIETGHGMSPGAVIEAFERARQIHSDGWALFHSRYTTDGVTGPENCHPFIVGGDPRTVLAHNGVLPDDARPGKGDDRSDSRILAEDLIPSRFGKLWTARGRRNLSRWMLRDSYPNKIAILTVDPRYRANAYIVNEKVGTWVNGVWHSNTGYVAKKSYYGGGYGLSDYAGWSGAYTSGSGAYSAYRSGEISYSEYLDQVYGGIRRNDCEACEGVGTVNPSHGYCRTCKVCQDCLCHIEVCDCWTPETLRAECGADIGAPVATLESQASAILSANPDGEHC